MLFAFTLAVPHLPAQDFDANRTHTVAPSPARAEANAALEARDYPLALKLLKKLAAEDPKDAHVLYDLAYTQDALDQNSEAEASYRAAIADDGNYIDPRVGLGLLLARVGRTAEARTELLAATAQPNPKAEDAPLRAHAFRALARLDQTARNFEASRSELLAALKLSPETPDDMAMAADLAVQADDLPEAEEAYRRLLQQSPGDPAATAALGHILLLEKKPREAEPLLTAALDQHPGDPTLTAQLASIYTSEERIGEAIPMVERIHAARPTDQNIARLLGHLYAENGDWAKAEPLFAALITLTPQDPALLDDRADALIHLRRYAEAEDLLKRAVANPRAFTTPGDLGSAAGHLAFAASENGDPQTCLQAIELRAKVLPTSPATLWLTAISHDKLHQVKQAKDSYQQFLAIADGKFPDQEFQARHRLVALEHMK
ncbi:Tetratricopeptide repeat-containing protein [Granulicella rosea]|uniref:Tetratricopeptide repeat-containing protein n=1 Tax=Granulicella rosea TaxID=474952 RepID=A0A239HRT1_9BACT|nr:tetratricopeptide repeat protein [Granulicella rosea]SNS84012.1 Tetratricopeptide repeat-containing protein [Granulicella rosea]